LLVEDSVTLVVQVNGKKRGEVTSKKNTVDPDDIIATYGADVARWFMLSDSPPDRDSRATGFAVPTDGQRRRQCREPSGYGALWGTNKDVD
jgi:isoleucyl-tRNA synthetase